MGSFVTTDTLDLINAAKSGDLNAVKKALKRGANIHEWDDLALCWAATNGHHDIVKYLVEHGANIHVLNDYALRDAARRGHLQVVNYFRKIAGYKWKCHNCIIRSTCLELCEDFQQY